MIITRALARSRSALCCGLVLAAGCASKPAPPPAPTQVDGSVQASASANPSISNRPSPVTLRIYELKSADSFNTADFIALYQRDQAELGADLVSRDEMIMQPGESRPWNRTLSPDTRFIGVFAAFRDTERARWRSVLAVLPNQKQHVLIRADGLVVSVTR